MSHDDFESVPGLPGPLPARFTVEDDGPGVPEAAQAHLFEPFFTTRAHGTGLGLAIARQSIEDAGGTLSFQPRGRGSSFEIRVGA